MNNKKLRILVDLLLIGIGIVFLVFGIKDAYNLYMNSQTPDNITFKSDYRYVEKDNIYKYQNIKEVNELLKDGSGVILIGNPSDTWTQVLVKPLHDYVKDYVDEIYYLETEDLDESQKGYDELKSMLGELSTPRVIIVSAGEILEDLSKDDIYDSEFDGAPIEYFDEENIASLQNKLSIIASLK